MTGTGHPQAGANSACSRTGGWLDFDPDPSLPGVLDGAWWPRSRHSAVELVDLVTALDARQVRVDVIMLNPGPWLGHPRRLQAAGHAVRVSWRRDMDAAVITVATDSHELIDLLVFIVDAASDPLLAALLATDEDDGQAAEILRAALLRPGAEQTGPPCRNPAGDARHELQRPFAQRGVAALNSRRRGPPGDAEE